MTTPILTILLIYPALYLVCFVALFLTRRPVGPITRDDAYRPGVTVIIASAGEEPNVIRTKIENTLALRYPPELLEIILFSDGRPFPAAVDRNAFPGIRFLQFDQLGKTECQNRSVALASGEVIIFTDITSLLEPDALSRLVRWYADGRVGSVGGSFDYRFSGANVEAEYVAREIRKKAGHAHYGIVTGYFGPLYSVRRAAYPVMPAFYPSDYMLPVLVARNGLSGIMDPEARSYRVLQRSMEQELVRKRRIIAQAGAATLHFLRGMGSDWRGHLDLVSAILVRKLFRWFLVPYGLILYLALLCYPTLFLAATAAGLGMVSLSLVYRRSGGSTTVLLAPYYGLVIAGATMLALFDVLRGETYPVWNPGSR
jgi:hypothetical protein